jgi:inward rectifier potassium channel
LAPLLSFLSQALWGRRDRRIVLGGRQVISTGLSNTPWNDFYHHCMTVTWPGFFSGVIAVFILLNGFFALLFSLGDHPIANLPPEHPSYLIYFSIETLSTVGYGFMYPQTHYAHIVASTEMFTGLVYAAVMTGLIFARFSRPQARFVFARTIAVGQHEAKPTLMIRVANARHNTISDASASLWLIRTETTAENMSFRRFHNLKLERSQNPIFVLSWTLFHVVDESSPLSGMSEESLSAMEAALVLSIQGHDEHFASLVNDRKTYSAPDFRFNHRYVDILQTDANGGLRLDYRRFHDVEPERPSKDVLDY